MLEMIVGLINQNRTFFLWIGFWLGFFSIILLLSKNSDQQIHSDEERHQLITNKPIKDRGCSLYFSEYGESIKNLAYKKRTHKNWKDEIIAFLSLPSTGEKEVERILYELDFCYSDLTLVKNNITLKHTCLDEKVNEPTSEKGRLMYHSEICTDRKSLSLVSLNECIKDKKREVIFEWQDNSNPQPKQQQQQQRQQENDNRNDRSRQKQKKRAREREVLYTTFLRDPVRRFLEESFFCLSGRENDISTESPSVSPSLSLSFCEESYSDIPTLSKESQDVFDKIISLFFGPKNIFVNQMKTNSGEEEKGFEDRSNSNSNNNNNNNNNQKKEKESSKIDYKTLIFDTLTNAEVSLFLSTFQSFLLRNDQTKSLHLNPYNRLLQSLTSTRHPSCHDLVLARNLLSNEFFFFGLFDQFSLSLSLLLNDLYFIPPHQPSPVSNPPFPLVFSNSSSPFSLPDLKDLNYSPDLLNVLSESSISISPSYYLSESLYYTISTLPGVVHEIEKRNALDVELYSSANIIFRSKYNLDGKSERPNGIRPITIISTF